MSSVTGAGACFVVDSKQDAEETASKNARYLKD
jgi:hypothetical protein